MSDNEKDDLFDELSDLKEDLQTDDGPFPTTNNVVKGKNKGQGGLFDDMISIEEEMRSEDRVLYDKSQDFSPNKPKTKNSEDVVHKRGQTSETELFSDLNDLDLNEHDERIIFKKKDHPQPSKTVSDESSPIHPTISKTKTNKISEKELFSDLDDLNLNQDDERVIFKKKEDDDTSVKAVLSRIKEKRSRKTNHPPVRENKSEDLFDDLGDLNFDD